MKYILKKVIMLIITLLIVSFLVFFSFTLISGDAAISRLGTNATEESVALLQEELGLNQPIYVQYANWLLHFIQGDFGVSYNYNIPVTTLLLEKLPITITLTAMSFLIILSISIPTSLYMMKHRGKLGMRFLYFMNHVYMAIPPFFLGIIITFVFGFIFVLFVPGNYISYTSDFGAFVTYLFFPALAIAIPKAAMASKLLYSSMEKELQMNYVRTAFSRGNKTSKVLYGHILKNAMIPVITFLGMILADIVTGSIIIEQVFSIPGIGRILLTSILHRDVPVVQAIIVLMATFIIFINTAVDIIYHVIDPRIEVE